MHNYIFMIAVLSIIAVAVTIITLVGLKLTDAQYDRLKKITLKWSAITTFLGVIVATFNVPFGKETITIVAALGAFLAYALDVSNSNYNEGANVNGLSYMEDDDDADSDI